MKNVSILNGNITVVFTYINKNFACLYYIVTIVGMLISFFSKNRFSF